MKAVEGEKRCSRWAERPTWFRMFLTDEVMLKKTKRQRLSCKEKYELMKELKARVSIQFTVHM